MTISTDFWPFTSRKILNEEVLNSHFSVKNGGEIHYLAALNQSDPGKCDIPTTTKISIVGDLILDEEISLFRFFLISKIVLICLQSL